MQMTQPQAQSWKRVAATNLKRLARAAASSVVPVLPDAVANRLPFLGRVSVPGPGGRRFRFLTYGPAGKDRIALKLCRQGYLSYEQETVRVFLPLLEKSRVFLDVGANTGMFAIFAGVLDPGRSVVAFEPIPSIFETLQANIELNGLKNVTAERLAASDCEGELVFYVSRTGGGIPTDSSSTPGFRTNVEEVRVRAVTIDQYMDSHHLGKVDFLKIDAETAEPKVLAGASRTIARDRPFIICEVLDCLDSADLQRLMVPFDYQYFHLAPEGPVHHERISGSPGRGARNYLFLPRERVNEALELCRAPRWAV
jgi:FkbM family methyltransferase